MGKEQSTGSHLPGACCVPKGTTGRRVLGGWLTAGPLSRNQRASRREDRAFDLQLCAEFGAVAKQRTAADNQNTQSRRASALRETKRLLSSYSPTGRTSNATRKHAKYSHRAHKKTWPRSRVRRVRLDPNQQAAQRSDVSVCEQRDEA